MGEDPRQIREDIERTREQMSDTVEAIGYKADIPSRTKEKVAEKKDAVEVKQGARRAKGIAQENPLGLAIGGAAVGFLVGLALPSTTVEDEKLGPMADDVKAKAQETGREALERGKQVAQDAAEAAKETAQESGQRHGEQLKAGATS
jgi:ElaB/YqjD/DUF883 family membrane-anchored ribosome-binding protein